VWLRETTGSIASMTSLNTKNIMQTLAGTTVGKLNGQPEAGAFFVPRRAPFTPQIPKL
jgi:hypothetical protein